MLMAIPGIDWRKPADEYRVDGVEPSPRIRVPTVITK